MERDEVRRIVDDFFSGRCSARAFLVGDDHEPREITGKGIVVETEHDRGFFIGFAPSEHGTAILVSLPDKERASRFVVKSCCGNVIEIGIEI